MFNIHHLREQWELYPIEVKSGELMKLLNNDKERTKSQTWFFW